MIGYRRLCVLALNPKNHELLAVLVATVFTFVGCGLLQGRQVQHITLQQRLLPLPNPTSYEFEASVGDVKSALHRAYNEHWRLEQCKKNEARFWAGDGDAKAKRLLTMELQLPPGFLFWKGDADALSKQLLTKPGNENDAYFYGTDSPVGESQVYVRNSKPLIYYADFHIHLTSLAPDKTRVEILTYDSVVVVGVEKSWSPHGTSFIAVKVDPTTVEEYQILLRIGEQLGAKRMLPISVPTPQSPVKELTLPRKR
jgi:hypothetical protein